jgi:hypothetical protein
MINSLQNVCVDTDVFCPRFLFQIVFENLVTVIETLRVLCLREGAYHNRR